MMKGIFLILTLTFIASQGWTQESMSHQYSSAPDTSRFQIVQSGFGVRHTFNIDKYLGNVFLLVEGDAGFTWELMTKEEQLYDETQPNQVNYQLFISGHGAKFIFLLNVNTGITWQLARDKTLDVFWWMALE